MSETERCAVYRSKKKDEHYLFVPRKDDFSKVPEAILKSLGGLDLAMELELVPGKKLARTTSDEVLESFQKQGFYLQMPPPPHEIAEAVMERISKERQQ